MVTYIPKYMILIVATIKDWRPKLPKCGIDGPSLYMANLPILNRLQAPSKTMDPEKNFQAQQLCLLEFGSPSDADFQID